ncbi:MAG: DUF4340 domain-containing protein [Gammaproteobacteria bacterium]|nr:DUF4340 domain-containing protein [Gammaproteobacteria bacterium]MBT8444088.1 DUF4340 domain-containing protein [Gammaproteobacteria bacterium]
MQSRSFLILFTAVLIMVALLYTQPNDPWQGQQQLILPGLSTVLNDVERVTVIGAGNQPIATLVRGDDNWMVEERDGYRADVGRIRRNLIALGNAKVVELKTTDPALHARLGVEDLASPDAAGKQFIVEAPGETFALIVGNTGARGGMSYVRRPDAAQSFLVSAELDPGETTTDWLSRKVLDIDSARVHAVTISHADGEVLRVEKAAPDATEYALADMPDGRELQYPKILDSMPDLLTNLEMDDVSEAEPMGDGKPVASNRFETFDGLIVEVDVFDTSDGQRAAIRVSADESLADRFTPTDGAENATGDQISFAAVADETRELNARLDGWLYALPSFKLDQLTRRTDDLLKPLE